MEEPARWNSALWANSRRSAKRPIRCTPSWCARTVSGNRRTPGSGRVIPVPALKPDEVLVYVMATGINYNNVWAALGYPLDVIQERMHKGEPGGLPCRRQRLLRHRPGRRIGRHERAGRRRGRDPLRLVGAGRPVGPGGQGPDAGFLHPHLGLPDQLRLLLPVCEGAGAPVPAAPETPDLGAVRLLPALRLDGLPDADGLAAAYGRAGRSGAGMGRVGRTSAPWRCRSRPRSAAGRSPSFRTTPSATGA